MARFFFIIKSIFSDLILSILYFPLWWYSEGLWRNLKSFFNRVKRLAHNLALKILITHLFKPMFGQYSRSGRIISFFMRLIHLAWRFFLFTIGFAFYLLLLLVWIVLPIFTLGQIFSKFLPLPIPILY